MVHEFRTTQELHYFSNIDFEIVRGDSRDMLLILTAINVEKLEDQLGKRYTTLQTIPDNSDLEEPFDLTGAVVRMMVRKTEDSSEILITKVSTTPTEALILTPESEGKVEIYFDPADTEDLDVGEYFFDIQVDTATSKRYTPVKGKMYVVGDVVR